MIYLKNDLIFTKYNFYSFNFLKIFQKLTDLTKNTNQNLREFSKRSFDNTKIRKFF